MQNVGEFWLIDLGSSNGTFLNKRRMHHPVKLCDQDQIIIGDFMFTFRQPIEVTNEYQTTFIERTIREIENVACWLLVADIENFTPLSRSLTTDKLARLIGGWVATCKEIIEAHEGMIDKYLGDGFFAYWRDDQNATKNVADALGPLKQAQARNEPRFRLALHFGLVAIGGVPSMGEESLMGKDVNFVFRMEKLAASLGSLFADQRGGKSQLGSLIKCEPAGVTSSKASKGAMTFLALHSSCEPRLPVLQRI